MARLRCFDVRIVGYSRTLVNLLSSVSDERYYTALPAWFNLSGMENEPTWLERVEWCKDAGMTSEQIAAEIGMIPKSLWEIESGRTRSPTGMTAVKLYKLSEKCRKKIRGGGRKR
jgi:DNA-binding XRE family transcriptional regulator